MNQIPSNSMQTYIRTAKTRQQRRLATLEQQRQQALAIAQQAAHILKTEFGAERVVVFGSLLDETFHEASDIDLAVWGLPEADYYDAVGKLISLSRFSVDLVEAQRASPEILAAVQQGQEL
ncbi:nucleotidyltransferase family protein [Trichothermofontia sp.]